MENGSLQYENQILKSELEAEHFILTQMAELGKVRNVRECQVAINNLLEKIGHFTKADRAYIVDEKDGCYYNTYEWCNEGIEPQINQLQNLRAEDMPYWIPKLSSGESIFIEDLENVKETMPVEYEILKPQNIHTLIVFPIILSNTLKGFIGVDNPNIKDAKDVIRLLAALGSYLGTTRENAAVYAKLEYRLNYDSLTKAYNRYGFYKNAQKLIKEHTDTEYCLILSDIKSFKLINEIYGENIADKILIDEDTLNKRIEELANQISKDYNGEDIVLVCTLKGAVYFTIDLSKKITGSDVILDFVRVSSYGVNNRYTGKLDFKLDISEDIENKNVIIIEDIIDSGITLNYLRDYLKTKNPKSLKICVLLDKKERRQKEINLDYVGFEIENKFVLGYGLDYDEKYRNLPYIGYVEE